ncbi:hypothetical protein IID20_01145 [Patescibacteria group bacterium]|nr:hypothetical protein [Patescibacteria group bacterium]
MRLRSSEAIFFQNRRSAEFNLARPLKNVFWRLNWAFAGFRHEFENSRTINSAELWELHDCNDVVQGFTSDGSGNLPRTSSHNSGLLRLPTWGATGFLGIFLALFIAFTVLSPIANFIFWVIVGHPINF